MTTGPEAATPILDVPDRRKPTALFGLKKEELACALAPFGAPEYRTRQLEQGLYQQWITELDELTPWPGSLRASVLESGFVVGLPRIAETFTSVDGTERYLIAALDGQTVETVWMPDGDRGEMGDGSEAARHRDATICISSQIGCAVNCQFCLTAKLGLFRNLTAGEIAGQAVAVLKRHKVRIGRDRINLVFMGMGEPFLNYDAFMDAVRLLIDEVGISASRMTVSTSGVVPGIERFARETVRPKLAISLNAPNDKIREQIMPINRKWNIERVLRAAREVPLGPREKLTFEYVLLGGLNDQTPQADEVGALLRKFNRPSKINLIVWNPGPGIRFEMPLPHQVFAFQERLRQNGIPAYIRRPRGRDIFAACGQLKRTGRVNSMPPMLLESLRFPPD